MPAMNMVFEYFFMAHTTISKDKSMGSMYIEATPSTQREAGFERAGLRPVEGTPGNCAKVLQRCYERYVEDESKGIILTPDEDNLEQIRRECLKWDEGTIEQIRRERERLKFEEGILEQIRKECTRWKN
jgi:hypothetical protein